MRERHNLSNFIGKNDLYRPIEVVTGRSERSDLVDRHANNNTPNNSNKLSDVHTQPKFERTYRFTHKKSIVRENVPRYVPEENSHLYTHNYNSVYKNNGNNYNGTPTYRDTGAASGNELKNSLIVNIPDPTNRINAVPANYQYPQIPRNVPEVYNEDYLYNTSDLRRPVVVKSNNGGYRTALGDLYSGLESIGMALCKVIAVTGQGCLKACQIIEDYSTKDAKKSETSFNDKTFVQKKAIVNNNFVGKRSETEKLSPKFGGSTSSVTSLCSAPLTLNERKYAREAIDKYLSGDKINLRCKFEVDYDDQDLSSTWIDKSVSQRANTNKYSETPSKLRLTNQVERCNQLNSLKNNLPSGPVENLRLENAAQSPRHTEIALPTSEDIEVRSKSGDYAELTLNNPLDKKIRLPSFKQLEKMNNTINRLVDKVENVELSKLNNNLLPTYMDSDKSARTESVKSLDNFSNEEALEKKEELAINELVKELEDKDKKKKRGGLNRMKLQRNRRC